MPSVPNSNLLKMIESYLDEGDNGFVWVQALKNSLTIFHQALFDSNFKLSKVTIGTPKDFKFALLYWIALQSFNPHFCKDAQANFDAFKKNYPAATDFLLKQNKKILAKLKNYFSDADEKHQNECLDVLKTMRTGLDNELTQKLWNFFQMAQPIAYAKKIEEQPFRAFPNTCPEIIQPGTLYCYQRDGHPVVAFKDINGKDFFDVAYVSNKQYDGVPYLNDEQERQMLRMDNKILQVRQELEALKYQAQNPSLLSRAGSTLAFLGKQFLPGFSSLSYLGFAGGAFNDSLTKSIDAKEQQLLQCETEKQAKEKAFYQQAYLEMQVSHVDNLIKQIHQAITDQTHCDLVDLLAQLRQACQSIPEDANHEKWPALKTAIEELPAALEALLATPQPEFNRFPIFLVLYDIARGIITLAGSLAAGVGTIAASDASTAIAFAPQILLAALLVAAMVGMIYLFSLQVSKLYTHHAEMAPEPNSDSALSRTT